MFKIDFLLFSQEAKVWSKAEWYRKKNQIMKLIYCIQSNVCVCHCVEGGVALFTLNVYVLPEVYGVLLHGLKSFAAGQLKQNVMSQACCF